MARLDDLQNKRRDLAGKIRNLADKHDPAQGDKAAPWDAEARQNWDALNAEYNANKAELDTEVTRLKNEAAEREQILTRVDELDAYEDFQPAPRNLRDNGTLERGPRNRGAFRTPEQLASLANDQALALRGWMLNTSPDYDLQRLVTDDHRNAARRLGTNIVGGEIKMQLGETRRFNRVQAFFRNGVRTRGDMAINAQDFLNAIQTGKFSTGGAFVGETLLDRLEQAQLSYSGMLQVAEILRTDNGEPLNWPMMDDTANTGTRVGEGQSGGDAADPVSKRLRLQAFDYTSGMLTVSRSFLEDDSIGIEGMFGDMLGTRIGRKQNVDFTLGADVGNGPTGLMLAAVSGLTAASGTAIAFDEVIDLVYKIDPGLRSGPGVGYMCHDLIINALRKLKDGASRYLWSEGTAAAEPDRLNGFPHWLNMSMDSTIASGKKTIAFGKLSNYKVRQVNEVRIQRLIERKAEYAQDVFIAYVRADGGLLNAGDNPVKYLLHP